MPSELWRRHRPKKCTCGVNPRGYKDVLERLLVVAASRSRELNRDLNSNGSHVYPYQEWLQDAKGGWPMRITIRLFVIEDDEGVFSL